MEPHENTLNGAISLDQLQTGEGGWISRIEGPEPILRRLLEMGVVEDSFIEVVHEAPFGKDPLAIRVRGGLLALRRQEAKHVWVRRSPSP
jgi:ferrous iron transport protein A